jgi:hypothetical protein
MSCLLRALAAVTAILMLTAASPANTISSNASKDIRLLWGKIGDFYKDLLEVGMSVLRSRPSATETLANPERWNAYICIQRLVNRAQVMERNLYGVTIATQTSSSLTDPVDEKWSLEMVRLTLSTTSDLLAGTRSEINAVMGGCARQSQLNYDKAKKSGKPCGRHEQNRHSASAAGRNGYYDTTEIAAELGHPASPQSNQTGRASEASTTPPLSAPKRRSLFIAD